MWRSKKLITAAVLVAVLLVGGIGGIAFAQTGSGDDGQPKDRCGALLDKVCEIYNANPDRPGDIDCALLKAAFAQAASEMRPKVMQNRPKMGPEAMQDRPKMDPEAMQDRLQNLVNEGKITQEQAKALQEWWEARPDLPLGFGPRGHGGFPRMGGFPGGAGPCIPPDK